MRQNVPELIGTCQNTPEHAGSSIASADKKFENLAHLF
jgi:hypothetical protein